ncbi:MAG: SPFH domain-containing protein [Clostridiales bacterium]|nr:SPFH domain-containing protein [Clostridiales bacterium]
MGFISNVAGTLSDSISSELKDQYIEVFRTDSLGQDLLIKRARSLNKNGFNKGNSEIISAGSKILVPEGTYAVMLDNGQVVDSVTEPGEYTWENSSSGTLLSGGVKSVMGDVFDRFRFAGEIAKSQRIYFINGLEIMNQTGNDSIKASYPDPVYGNLYFTFRITFSFRIVDPVTFFKRFNKETTVYDFMGSPMNPKMPYCELRDHMEEALNLCAVRDKIPFPKLLSNKSSLRDAVNEVVSKLWYEQRGMVVESIALTDLTLDEASRSRVEQYDSAKIFADDPEALKALAKLGFIEAMNTAAANPAGAVGGLAGVAMAGALGGTTDTTCPYCGTPIPSGASLEKCPACCADLKK